eukprot:TRINITY_DN2423_c0_g1_i2.p1 TRINITY_DN2423_c0_g1~~TRINITY_DN2423_c0_g1_i2.p1  ORF type:complete len:816 (+),score=151.06 TRINITY_DN2423_c0_g1_i2:187-2634(+)
MTLMKLESLSIEQQDMLITDNFISPLALPSGSDVEPTPLIEAKNTEKLLEQGDEITPKEEEPAEVDDATVVDEPALKADVSKVDKVFASSLENSFSEIQDTPRAITLEDNDAIISAHRLPQRQRQKEKSLTVTQTLQAIAVICEKELVQETWPTILESVGYTKEKKYVEYFWDLASRDLELEDKSDTSIWDAYIHSLGGCSDVLGAYETIEKMKSKGITPSLKTWNNLMRCYAYVGDCESALKVSENIRMYANLSPDHATFRYTMMAYAANTSTDRETGVRRAINSLYEMTEVYRLEPMRIHYETILKQMVYLTQNSEWYLKFMEMANQMKHIGIPWNTVTYELIMWVDATRGDINRVREWFVTMRKRKLPPTDRVYSAVIMSYACSCPAADKKASPYTRQVWFDSKNDEWERDHSETPPVDEWRDQMFEEGMAIYNIAKKHDGPINRTVHSMLYLVSFLKPEKLREMWEEVKHVAEKHPQLYGQYIVALTKSSVTRIDPEALDDAEKFFVEITMSGYKLERIAYESLMLAHIRSGREGSVDVALDYMSAMERSGYSMTSSFSNKLKRLIDEMGPKRDAIRRARLLETRRKSIKNPLYQSEPISERQTLQHPGQEVHAPGLTPDGFAFPSSQTGVNTDGTLVGESREDRMAALAQMGYQPVNLEDTSEIRREDKVAQWLKYARTNPRANFSPEHPSFDKLLVNRRDVTSAKDERQKDSRSSTYMAMEASRNKTDDFDIEKPYYSKDFAHTYDHPESWTPDQEAFIKSWKNTTTGKSHNETIYHASKLRGETMRERSRRMNKVAEDSVFPDEEDDM